MLRYAITDGEYGRRAGGSAFALSTGYSSRKRSAWIAEARESLLAQVRQLSVEGVEFLQIREKTLNAGEMAALSRDVMDVVRGSKTLVLLNTRIDVAVATGADGVHLGTMPGELSCRQVRQVFEQAGQRRAIVSRACHTLAEVVQARLRGADLILFSPIFGKTVGGIEVVHGTGLERLAEACVAAGKTPVLALGGMSEENTDQAIAVGALGVAGIRLFRSRLRPGIDAPPAGTYA